MGVLSKNFFLLIIFIFPLVALTLDPIIIFIYLFIIFLTFSFRKYFSEIVLVFFVSFIFLYPNVANSFSGINEKGIILGCACMVFYLLYKYHNYHKVNNKPPKRIIFSWFFWGSFVYLIALSGYVLFETFDFNILAFFGQPPLRTSHIMHYTNTIPMVFLFFAPIISIKNNNSFNYAFKLYAFLLSINVLFSLLQYFYGMKIIEASATYLYQSEIFVEKRLLSFSELNPLGFGRLISFPIILLFCYFLLKHRGKDPLYLVILLFAVLALLLTFGRTSYISTAVGLFTVFLIAKKNVKTTIKYVIIILLIILVVEYADIPSYFSSVPRLTNPMGSLDSRLYKHRIALNFIEMNPLFGTFPGRMIELSKTIGPHEIDRSAHSLYLSTGVNYGIPMILIIIFTLIYSFLVGKSLLKKYDYLLSLKENSYITIFLIASTAYTLSITVHGITETVPYGYIFLNLGYIITARNILIKQSKNMKIESA